MNREDCRPAAGTAIGVFLLLAASLAACSSQNRYAPPVPKACEQRVICVGDGGRLSRSALSCRCGRLSQHTG